MNAEQQPLPHLQFFGRWGWNEGRHESFVYSEVNEALELGVAFTNIPRRKNDHAGTALSLNGISGDHRRYLALGGLGFLVGDGALDYARERIAEGYYTLHVWTLPWETRECIRPRLLIAGRELLLEFLELRIQERPPEFDRSVPETSWVL